MTTTNHNLPPSSLTSIMALGSSSSTSLSRRRSVICHKVDDTSTYKSESYPVVTDAYQV